MADEDDIDILGDFSFNSCLAQNTQGIPSCSDREDTIHPQWLLDSTENNWYDIKSKELNRYKDGSSRKLSGNSSVDNYENILCTTWTASEKRILGLEMEKYGRNIRKISQKIKTKSEAEIQALIEAEYGINLEMPLMGLEKLEDEDNIPAVVQEEIVTEEIPNLKSAIDLVTTGTTTVTLPKYPLQRKTYNTKSKRSIKSDIMKINPSQLLYEDDIILGSTESVGNEYDKLDIVSKSLAKHHKEKARVEKKLGNHRRKISKTKSTSRSKSKDLLSSPPGRQRKDSNKSVDNKSPKMQIVLGSGWALPVSEGEQVIKIEKKRDIESESDVEVDIDSDNDVGHGPKEEVKGEIKQVTKEASVPMPLRKFEPMPKRKKKMNLDGEGGYTIMHTESGDMYEIASEPRKERQPKKSAINLLQCRVYNVDKPAPYEVRLFVSTLISMDVHAHTSRGEVMGLLGGSLEGATVTFQAYRRALAASCSTHCDMDPVSQSAASEWLLDLGLQVCGWHHSHPQFPAAPSAVDLRSQRALQAALDRPHRPFLAVVTSQHWAPGRAQSQYKCFRVEDDGVSDAEDLPTGYQLSMKLVADLTHDNLSQLTQQLQDIIRDNDTGEYGVDMLSDVCPQAGITHLEKCISSVSHHMRSAGYSDDDSVVKQLIEGIRDVFR